MYDTLTTWTLKDFEDYNEKYYRGDFRGSEATPYKIENVKKWIAVRDSYKPVKSLDDIEDFSSWEELDIGEVHSKYGINYIYIDPVHKLWRITQTGDEFYGSHRKPFEI